MKLITGSDVIYLIKASMKNDDLQQELLKLSSKDFDSEDLVVKAFFKFCPEGFKSEKYSKSNSETKMGIADTLSMIRKEIVLQGIRKAYNLLKNIEDPNNEVVKLENSFNNTIVPNTKEIISHVKNLTNFLSKYASDNNIKTKLVKAASVIKENNVSDAAKEIYSAYESFFSRDNIKTAFVTLKNQVGEGYQLCPKSIYISGHPSPMALSNCRDYCIDVRKEPDGNIGCNYLKWMNDVLITNEQAWHLFDKMDYNKEGIEYMNLQKGERHKFPISDQDSQDLRIKRMNNIPSKSFEYQLEERHKKNEPIDRKKEPSVIMSDSAIEEVLKDFHEYFGEDELENLEILLRKEIGK